MIYRNKLTVILALAFALAVPPAAAQRGVSPAVRTAVAQYFQNYHVEGYRPHDAMGFDSLRCDDDSRTLSIYANEPFTSQPLTDGRVADIYKGLSRRLPNPYNTYRLAIYGKSGQRIEDLVPNIFREGRADRSRLWGDVEHKGYAWVTPLSQPYEVSRGLQGRHLMINPSHGRYWNGARWRWQRPALFCTTEDLLTQSIVFPYLIPMLEKAGAVVVSARERDCQTAEAIVDNDAVTGMGSYSEAVRDEGAWTSTPDGTGFAPVPIIRHDSIQPFRTGTARKIASVSRRTRLATATWTPRLPRTGRYAVYVSYATVPGSVPDAHYTVYHKGGRTSFRVNQQMGGGTWVYLGTFDFDEGESSQGRVVLTNQSNYRGFVTADGVRFGGGVGMVERGGNTSGFARFLEGARYHAQWSGLPDTLLGTDPDDSNDYKSDIRARSNMLNHMAGGSAYMPGTKGMGVPLEMVLALHSDAGTRPDHGIYGTLAICTTVDGLGQTEFPAGMSRRASEDMAAMLLSQVTADMSRTWGTQWTQRELWDRNYGETRTPDLPAVILEMFSHQNFGDMKYAHDPLFKFSLARAIYKAVLRFVAYQHGEKHSMVAPLPPTHLAATLTADNHVRLSWRAQTDSVTGDNAAPTAYVVYTKVGDEGYDNGRLVSDGQSVQIPVSPGQTYSFQVTAVNAGGESFPGEQLAVRQATKAGAPRVLIVNGFDRLSGPARIETPDSVGFLLDVDPGVPYGASYALCGRQQVFDAHSTATDAPLWLGHSSLEYTGDRLTGNTFDYPVRHAADLSAAGDYTIVSCSRDAMVSGQVRPADYDMVDYICGLQRDVPYNLKPFKTFPDGVRRVLTDYMPHGGRLLVSGSFIGSDMQREDERRFTREVMHYDFAGSARADSTGIVRGLNLNLPLQRDKGGDTYAVIAPDALVPVGNGAFTAFAYGQGQSAGIAYSGKDCRVVAMGFPFEGIADADLRRQTIRALVDYLTK